jgi:PA14 domain
MTRTNLAGCSGRRRCIALVIESPRQWRAAPAIVRDAMTIAQVELSRGRLAPHLAVALAIHAALFAFPSIRPALALVSEEGSMNGAPPALNVDLEAAVPEPPPKPPGGGAPIAGDSRVAMAPPPLPIAARRPRAAAPMPVAAVERPLGDRLASRAPDPPMDPAVSGGEVPSSMAAAQASDDRRDRDLAMAAAAASAGVGQGAGGGPGGGGAGWGAPAIRGSNAFGNGTHGALTGRVCFLPVGTLRIADVGECPYVATIYTDTLDIPERQFYDGFPGVTNRSDWFLIDYTGTFSVAGYGTYEFRIHSDDGSYLYIDDALIIENDGKHAPESRRGCVQLAVGDHRIKVRYAQTTDRMALQLFVRAPGAAETIFTPQF